MNDFLYEATIYIETLTAIVASIYYYKYRYSKLKYFLIFLWYIVINESIGKFYIDIKGIQLFEIYNIYIFIKFNFLFFIYWNFLKKKRHISLTKLFALIFSIIYFIDFLYLENFNQELLAYSFMIGSSFLMIVIFFYYIEILNSEKVFDITKDILFWISFGVLLFNLGNIPWYIVRKYFLEIFIENTSILIILSRCLLFIFNFCFIIGFIWGQKIQRHQQS